MCLRPQVLKALILIEPSFDHKFQAFTVSLKMEVPFNYHLKYVLVLLTLSSIEKVFSTDISVRFFCIWYHYIRRHFSRELVFMQLYYLFVIYLLTAPSFDLYFFFHCIFQTVFFFHRILFPLFGNDFDPKWFHLAFFCKSGQFKKVSKGSKRFTLYLSRNLKLEYWFFYNR